MVRPTALPGLLRKFVATNHRGLVASNRQKNIVSALRLAILDLKNQIRPTKEIVRILDVGCGNLGIAEALSHEIDNCEITCIDTYAPPSQEAENLKWKKYRQFDGMSIPFNDDLFDLTICVDVLHHAGISGAENLLREMLRTSQFIIVKDHFEYGLISRTLLQLADFYGNWGYGVNVPKRYFNVETWGRIIKDADLLELRRYSTVQVHGEFFSKIFPPKLHFISVLTRKA